MCFSQACIRITFVDKACHINTTRLIRSRIAASERNRPAEHTPASAMLAGIKFVDRSEAERALEEERKALRKQKKKEKKVRISCLPVRHLHVSRFT